MSDDGCWVRKEIERDGYFVDNKITRDDALCASAERGHAHGAVREARVQ